MNGPSSKPAPMASWYLPGALLLMLALPAHALSTDKDQPIEVEADTAELDEVKNVSIYRGNVIVIQGSIRMTGDVMTVYQTDNDDLDHMIMEGNPATYKQLPDDSKQQLVMNCGFEKCLVLYTKEEWTRITTELNKLNTFVKES